MRTLRISAAVALLTLACASARAECPASASKSDLQSFNADPVKWIRDRKGSPDVGANARSLAAAAVNARDPAFGRSLSAVLGHASGSDGQAIGRALGGLGTSCGSPSQAEDQGDKLYIADDIVRAVAANTEASQGFGSGEPQSAATGGGGGAGAGGGASSGVGSVGQGPQSGGSNNSAVADPTPAVIPRASPETSTSIGSAGSFTTQSNATTTIGSNIID